MDIPIGVRGYMRLWDKNTGAARGYIAADASQNVMTVPTNQPNDYLCLVWFGWGPIFGSVWLNSDNAAFQNRQIGLGTANVADWGIPSPGGWRDPLFYADDQTLELADNRGRFLSYPTYSSGNLYWSGNGSDPTILCGVLEPN